MRKIELSYQKNARDLGGVTGYKGLKVKEGKVFRGGFLGRVSEKDIETINALKLTDIIDLRSLVEFNDRPDYHFEGVTYHNFPTLEDSKHEELRKNNEYDDSNLLWFLFGSTDGVGHMKRTYVDVLTSEVGVNAYRHFFEVLLQDSKRVVYFHCSQGKDRAGIASYLFLSALGVSEEDKIADYLYSNEAMQVRIKQYKAMLNSKPYYNKEYEKALEDVFSAKLEYLFTAIKFMEESCGGVLNYLVDVLHVDIDKLRNYYLE